MSGDLNQAFKWLKGFRKGDAGKILTVNEQVRARKSGSNGIYKDFKNNIGRKWCINRADD